MSCNLLCLRQDVSLTIWVGLVLASGSSYRPMEHTTGRMAGKRIGKSGSRTLGSRTEVPTCLPCGLVSASFRSMFVIQSPLRSKSFTVPSWNVVGPHTVLVVQDHWVEGYLKRLFCQYQKHQQQLHCSIVYPPQLLQLPCPNIVDNLRMAKTVECYS